MQQPAYGRFSPEVIQEVRDRVSLLDVVRQNVSLKRRGRDWWGCCPFHQEDSASFHVRDEQGYYHCFGCGAHGNVLDYVQQIRGLNFPEAVEYLAGIGGVRLVREKIDPAVRQRRLDGMAALEKATAWYQQNLQGPSLEYLVKRGLSPETIATFRLGVSPDAWRDLKNRLLAEGFGLDALRGAGLIRQSDKGGEDYDVFRGRVMFPIQDMQGRPVAFGGRTMDGSEPKYLNSSETDFFHKSRVLYGLYHAAPQIRRESQLLLVEGYMDVVGLWQHGVKTAVAPLGTAVTPEQIELLWRYHDNPIVCLDGDNAGRQAAERLAERALKVLKPGKGLSFAWMPEGEDPDSFIKNNGKEAFTQVLGQAVTLEDVLWQGLAQGHNLASGQGRAAVDQAIGQLVKQIENPTMSKHLARALNDKLWQAIRQSQGRRGAVADTLRVQQAQTVSEDGFATKVLLALLLHKPALVARVAEPFARLTFKNQRLKALQDTLLRYFASGGVDTAEWDTHLNRAGLTEDAKQLVTRCGVRKLLADSESSSFSEQEQYWLRIYADSQGPQATRQMAQAVLDQADSSESIALDPALWQQFKAAKAVAQAGRLKSTDETELN